MDQPLTVWYCDVCGNPIEKDSAYVLWHLRNGRSSGFQIVHRGSPEHGGCDERKRNASGALTNYLGIDGLSRCLAIASAGPIILVRSEGHRSIDDLDNFVDFVRRLHVPYYEEARLYFSDSTLGEDFNDASESYPYSVDKLKSIIETYG